MSEWISMKDRIPDQDKTHYLIYSIFPYHGGFPKGEIGIGYWKNKEEGWYGIKQIVTHWMPLPEPPENV